MGHTTPLRGLPAACRCLISAQNCSYTEPWGEKFSKSWKWGKRMCMCVWEWARECEHVCICVSVCVHECVCVSECAVVHVRMSVCEWGSVTVCEHVLAVWDKDVEGVLKPCLSVTSTIPSLTWSPRAPLLSSDTPSWPHPWAAKWSWLLDVIILPFNPPWHHPPLFTWDQ